MRFLQMALIVMMTALLWACSSNPLGMSDDEWDALTPEQKLEARQEQARLEQRRRELASIEERARQEQEHKERELLQQRLATARYGEIVQCMMPDPLGHLSSGWRQAEPLAFTAVIGFEVPVTVERKDRPTQTITGEASFDGQTLRICRHGECARIVGLEADYRDGYQQSIDIRRFVQGEIRCQFPRGRR
ncbi:MAG: hypothetical protein LAT77_11750 [Aliidiomarina sp.]|uniref:hypothetical protein n=1 Tax=Aliidiomarina sp. TaxID=1872439 RepID=UPI0025BED736|nr:hypothetical protein [Aliidiomarina sp.]MCH8502569.1 hypothetical protein [Aliidiomarina sp.]